LGKGIFASFKSYKNCLNSITCHLLLVLMDYKIVVEIPLQSDRYALMGCSKLDGIQLPFWGGKHSC
jgi:hypothetical protein